MITDNTAKWRVGSISTPQVNSGDGLLPVGHVYYSMGSSAPAGSLPLWGQLFSRETYKDLWEWVNLHPEQLLSESAWQTKYIENNGLVPFYSEGTDSTNFRVPNVINLGTEGMDFVVEEGKEGLNWWRVWKSGWLEQGGTVSRQGTSGTISVTFPKKFKDTYYFLSGGNTYTANSADDHQENPNEFVSRNETGFVKYYYANFNPWWWEARGYGVEIPQTERVLWCVKAFGNIDESVGSTSLTNIANNITQLNTKVDNWVSGTLDSHATAIAKMQSYFNGSYEKTLLAGGTSKDKWIGSGNISLADSWKNYDILQVFATNDSSTGHITVKTIKVPDLKDLLDIAISSSKSYFYLWDGNHYYSFNPSTTTEVLFNGASEDSGIQAIYGIKLKATGITNKSALDVSQISDKVSSLLTTDNHLRLPSGLEVW